MAGIEEAREKIDRVITENAEALHLGSLGLTEVQNIHTSYRERFNGIENARAVWGPSLEGITGEEVIGVRFQYNLQKPAEHFFQAEEHCETALGLCKEVFGNDPKDKAEQELVAHVGAIRILYGNFHLSCSNISVLQDEIVDIHTALQKLPSMIGISDQILRDSQDLEGMHSRIYDAAFNFVTAI